MTRGLTRESTALIDPGLPGSNSSQSLSARVEARAGILCYGSWPGSWKLGRVEPSWSPTLFSLLRFPRVLFVIKISRRVKRTTVTLVYVRRSDGPPKQSDASLFIHKHILLHNTAFYPLLVDFLRYVKRSTGGGKVALKLAAVSD